MQKDRTPDKGAVLLFYDSITIDGDVCYEI